MNREKTIIIAEAGVNHNGDLNLAYQLIDIAARAKADYVKFQTFKAEKLASSDANKAAYQAKTDDRSGQLSMLKKLELDNPAHTLLMDYAAKKNIGFISTPFDPESADMLDQLGIDLFKIPSGEITNLVLLKKIAKFGKPVIMSTGMSDMDEIEAALNILISEGLTKGKITLLHCNTQYPTPMGDVNLLAMKTLADKFGVSTGYSDHTEGIEVSIAAIALGAKVIEKHFTIDKNLPGPDHAASLDPEELGQLVKSIRNIEKALGSSEKKPSGSETENINIVRKSIHLAGSKRKGDTLSEKDLIMLRPGDGISPMKLNSVLGKALKKDLSSGYKLKWEDLE